MSKQPRHKKTNACRALDALSIRYELRDYEVDESDLSATKVARQLGLAPEVVLKTLCLRADDKSILLAIVPADGELDLKALAKAADKKAVTPVAVKELPGLTGYIRGGVTALACKKPYPVFIEQSSSTHMTVCVSAGQRGLQLQLSPMDYARAVNGMFAPIVRPKIDA